MTVSEPTAIWLLGTVATLAATNSAFLVLTQWRLGQIEKKLGNGEPGLYARREDLNETREELEQVREEYVRHSELELVCRARHAEMMRGVMKGMGGEAE